MINKTQFSQSNEAIKAVSIKLAANKRVSEHLRVDLIGNLSRLMSRRVSSQKWH